DLAKNVVHDTLNFALRIDTQKLPAELLRAYYQVELDALAAGNPSGRPSARRKREVREAARAQLAAEAPDGRYLRPKGYPVLWDAQSNELLVGTTSAGILDRLHTLFQQTFDRGFDLQGAGKLAYLQAEGRGQTRGVDDAAPSAFVPGAALREVAWLPDEANR